MSDDRSADLQVFAGAGLQSLDLKAFGAGGVIHLTGGAGGSVLSLGSGTIHFEPGIPLTPARFQVG